MGNGVSGAAMILLGLTLIWQTVKGNMLTRLGFL